MKKAGLSAGGMRGNMGDLTARQLIDFLGKVEKLKSIPRHCVTKDGVQEYVAGHSWRAALMAFLIQDELSDVDMNKVIKMCLIHDIGEAVTGDIPSFHKTKEHESIEKDAVNSLISELPDRTCREWKELFREMEALETMEAKVYKALDKLEAVIQHNESDITTWLPLEYELQKTYAAKNSEGIPFIEDIHRQAVKDTEEKIKSSSHRFSDLEEGEENV